jgi:ribonucleoside-diphosphate reductase alpha chain
MGLKAIAIYRDNSKRSQPLNTGKKKDTGAADSVEAVAAAAALTAASAPAEPRPYRRRLPAERTAITHKFDIAGHEGYITVGLYPDGQPGEIFLKMAKEGSTISGLMDTFATTVSVALQYGVPLHDLVHKFAHVRFEPSGFTSNPEIPIAKSIIDYIFRWLGSRFLPAEDRATLGLVDRSATAESSVQPLTLGFGTPGAGIAGTPESGSSPAAGPASAWGGDAASEEAAPSAPTATATSTPAREWPNDAPRSEATSSNGNGHAPAAAGLNGNGKPRVTLGNLGIGKAQVTFTSQADAPSCADCGSIMVRNGSCYKCLNCGSTSGCS